MMMTENEAAMFIGDDQAFILGAQFVGALFDSMLAGVILCQLTRWIPNAKYDNRIVQVLVAIGAIAALATTVYTWADYLLAFVYDFGKFSRFASFEMLGWYPIFDGFTVVPVQLFFAERAVRINGNSLVIAIVSGVLIASTFAAAIGVTVSTRGQTMIMPTDAIKIISVLWPTICTSAHVFITTSIISGLLRTRTGSEGSNKIVNRVVAVSLESQLPATIFAVAAMTAIASNPKGPLVPFIIIVHPKVFMVGCLAMVNLRHSWRITGKIPSTYNSSTSGITDSTPELSSLASGSQAPSTPKLGLVRGFSGPPVGYTLEAPHQFKGLEKRAFGV